MWIEGVTTTSSSSQHGLPAEHIVLCPGWEMCHFKPSLKEFIFFVFVKVYIADVFFCRWYTYVWPMFGLMLRFYDSVFVCILEGPFISEVTTSRSSLNMDLKFFSMWDHSLDCFWLFLFRKSLVLGSCGMFSLKEAGLFICYQPTSATDSVWTLTYYR